MEDLESSIRHYYRYVEEYDWTHAIDHVVGPETLFHRMRCREALKLVHRHYRRGRCLDVGCGTAAITRRLPGRPIGVDLNPRNLEKARRYTAAGDFLLCDAEAGIPLRDNSFQLVVCTEMLEHLLHPESALDEIHRVLLPDGWLVGSVPSRSFVWRLRRLSRSRVNFVEEPYHKHYRRHEVHTLIARRFRIERLYCTNLRMNWFFVARKAKPTP